MKAADKTLVDINTTFMDNILFVDVVNMFIGLKSPATGERERGVWSGQ